MQVKTSVNAGNMPTNHNEAQVRATGRGLRVQTGVKAGGVVRSPIGSGGSPG